MPAGHATNLDLTGKRVFIRADYNVLLDEEGRIREDSRIRRSLPTIRFVAERGARVILASHLGRPGGRPAPGLTLRPVAERLSSLLDRPVTFVPDCIGDRAASMAGALEPGEVLLLENLRFHPGEDGNDPDFAGRLAALADIYVNDAFGVAHRACASNVGIVRHLRPALAGLLLEEEIRFFNRHLKEPVRPLAAVIGGRRLSEKMEALRALLGKADQIFIGGGMAATFIKARRGRVGDAPVEDDLLDEAVRLMGEADARGVAFHLPLDTVIVPGNALGGRESRTVPADEVPEGWTACDIGHQTAMAYAEWMADARTILWNGPLGMLEGNERASGSMLVGKIIARYPATTIIVCKETALAAERTGLADLFTFNSTGGSAFLAMLAGKSLPGLMALTESLRRKEDHDAGTPAWQADIPALSALPPGGETAGGGREEAMTDPASGKSATGKVIPIRSEAAICGVDCPVRIPERLLTTYKGVLFPKDAKIRSWIVAGPPGSGKSTLIGKIGGWPGEAALDLSIKGWWKAPPLSQRPREVHFTLPFEGIGETRSVYDERWEQGVARPGIDLARVRIPPDGSSFFSANWRARYLFDFILPCCPDWVFEKRLERSKAGSHWVDAGLEQTVVAWQLDIHWALAIFFHQSGLRVIVRPSSTAPPYLLEAVDGEGEESCYPRTCS